MGPLIGIVGMACRFPDANTPSELWENVLAQRRAFRRLPSERLRVEDYYAADPQAPDATYSVEAAVLEGYQFDRVKFRVAGATYRSADHAHWLALDVAAQALADAGYVDGAGWPRETTGVMVANTLTGEFARTAVLRHRWPYVRRVVAAALAGEGRSGPELAGFLSELEEAFKAPFAPIGEESLAGGLSNTIAGRICNHFDFKGGGYTVDGACASSLVAVATAGVALATGDVDVAVVGGVDLSLDPFELVGFAKAGALAADEMRVYDARSSGFWPGEGCGFVVLMRHEDALARGARVYALLRGWGISSDGAGGMTRPEEAGQRLALARAYQRAGYPVTSVPFFEGHGTGTAVGDTTELRTLARYRRETDPGVSPAAIGSVKANIGHTKAAAGMAGLLKAILAIQRQVLPPNTACERPHAELARPGSPLRVLNEPEVWPGDQPLRAGVSSMGFGGINAHVTIEAGTGERRRGLSGRERMLGRSGQDTELWLFAAEDRDGLRDRVRELEAIAGRLSRAELGDLSRELAGRVGAGGWRVAVVASHPAEMALKLTELRAKLDTVETGLLEIERGLFVGHSERPPRIGFLFPGQGSPANLDGGVYRRRFGEVHELYAGARFPDGTDGVATEVAQPGIVRATLAGLRVLRSVGMEASLGVGHSLGELSALFWAGALDEAGLLRLATVRGRAMAELGSPTGAMVGIEAGALEVRQLIEGSSVVISGLNSPSQTVVSGPAAEVAEVTRRAEARRLRCTRLAVSHAFHSPWVAGAHGPLAACLAETEVRPVARRVISTITGLPLATEDDLRALLCLQVTSPVRFIEAMTLAVQECDLFIEVGPGAVLGRLLGHYIEITRRRLAGRAGLGADLVPPVVSMDAGGWSLAGFHRAVGAAFVLGAPVDPARINADRFTKPFSLPWKPVFLANPCEAAPAGPGLASGSAGSGGGESGRGVLAPCVPGATEEPSAVAPGVARAPVETGRRPAIEVVRALVAERAELPVSAVRDDSRLLGDLHLNSISVGQLVTEAAQRLELPPLTGLHEFADSTVAGVAQALTDLALTGGTTRTDPGTDPAGIEAWVRPYTVEWVVRPPHHQAEDRPGRTWQVLAPVGHPWAKALESDLNRNPGGQAAPARGADEGIGVVVCLPSGPMEAQIPLLLEGAHRVLVKPARGCFVLIQSLDGGGGFAKTLHLETPGLDVSVVTLPVDAPQALGWAAREARGANGFKEVRYGADGLRREPELRLAEVAAVPLQADLRADDVLLVTAGGKGIAAECALAIGRRTGVRLLLCGRSRPEADRELQMNLERFRLAGVTWRYAVADVTEPEGVREALAAAKRDWGPVTGVLHGAGVNTPQLIRGLDEASVQRTAAPKVNGLRNVLAAIQPDRLRWLVTFSSIIARSGLRGEADYAFANEWLSRLTEEWAAEHPACRCLALEWSVWSGVGMGERLGRVEMLRREGIDPITPDTGLAVFERLVSSGLAATRVVVTGRFGRLPTLRLPEPELPLWRFLERPRVHYPGVELVVEARLSSTTDPYVEDHCYGGERLFPAVLGLEAMAQVAMALTGEARAPELDEVEFQRPVVVPRGGEVWIRIAAFVRGPGTVEVALRTDGTAFQVDHFRACCRFGKATELAGDGTRNGAAVDRGRHWSGGGPTMSTPQEGLAVDVEADLYGRILFQSGRFRCLAGYEVLRAHHCVARLREVTAGGPWFGPYLAERLVLGPAGLRDAGIHAIQACIPHVRVLPIGVSRIRFMRLGTEVGGGDGPGAGVEARPVLVRAWERARSENEFVYDVRYFDAGGEAIEEWLGLRLRVVEPLAAARSWGAPLLLPYLERRCAELGGFDAAMTLLVDERLSRSQRAEQAIGDLLGRAVPVRRRPDGRPEIAALSEPAEMGAVGPVISLAHHGGLTFAVAGSGQVACDLEAVLARPSETWSELLGPMRYRLALTVAGEAGEAVDAAATRLWVAGECLKKAGMAPDAPLMLESASEDGWVLFRAGSMRLATLVSEVKGCVTPLAFGVLAGAAAGGAVPPGGLPGADSSPGIGAEANDARVRIPPRG